MNQHIEAIQKICCTERSGVGHGLVARSRIFGVSAHAVMRNWFTAKILFLRKRISYANGVLLMGQAVSTDHMAELSQQWKVVIGTMR